MKKALIILTGGISSDGISSAWYSICREWRETKDRGCNIDLLEIEELSNQKIVSKFKDLGINIIPVPKRQSNPISYFSTLRRIMREGKYDIVHSNGSSSFMILEMLAAKLEGVTMRIAHSHNTTCNSKILHKCFFRSFNSLVTQRLACGVDAGRWLFGKNTYTIFHNGIDLAKFRFNPEERIEARKRLDLNSDTLAFGHVGKFNYQKNHEYLIRVFYEINKENPDSKLFLFGEGDLLNEIQQLVNSLGLEGRVIFMGNVDDIEFYLMAMDEMILPSRFEGLPNVVIEWQAAGLPSLVASSVTEECCNGDLVCFIPLSYSPKEWATQALNFVKTKKDRPSQSLYAIKSLKTNGFDISGQTEVLENIYLNNC